MFKKLKRIKSSSIFVNLFFTVLCLVSIIPFVIIISTSLQGKTDFMKNGYVLFPKNVDFASYIHIFNQPQQILESYGITIFVTLVGTVVGMILMTTLAYVISRDDYPYKNILSFFIYFTMLFSGGMVANYLWIAKYLDMANTVWALIIPSLMTPFNVFILRTACKSVPYSLIESAKLEGASEIWIFIRIIIPLAKTGIATIALMTIFTYWNSWFPSMMYINDNSYVTLQYYLVQLLENANSELNSMDAATKSQIAPETFRMAICSLVMVPMLFVFSSLQKYFVKGVTVGSVKG